MQNSKTAERVKASLEESGFYKVIDQLPEIFKLGKQMSINAGTNEKPRFEAFPSFISANAPILTCNCLLTIDIGGTSTKAAVRLCDQGVQEWKLLFELKNLDLQEVKFQENPFDAFCKILANHIERGLVSAGVPKDDVDACGVVWSNAMENKVWDKQGITGIIAQLEKYKKGEWFNQGLYNGRDIGNDFFSALSARKLRLNKLIIANDTPLTMKATKQSHAGMVASTGLNATLLKSAAELKIGDSTDRLICNSEMGGRFTLNEDLIGRFDKIDAERSANTVEYLTTGNFLPLLFTNYILECEELGLSELSPIKNHLQSLEGSCWEEFRSKDLSLLLSDIPFFLRRRTNRKVYSEEIVATLKIITEEIILRSAKLCAVIAHSSVANLPPLKTPYLISLDSRLAREIPIFWETLQSEICSEIFAEQKINLNLVRPIELNNGKISVPMIGLANALDSLIV